MLFGTQRPDCHPSFITAVGVAAAAAAECDVIITICAKTGVIENFLNYMYCCSRVAVITGPKIRLVGELESR